MSTYLINVQERMLDEWHRGVMKGLYAQSTPAGFLIQFFKHATPIKKYLRILCHVSLPSFFDE